jgi:hypothetical protein
VEDFGQLIFVVLFILFGLISSSKKKKAPPKTRASGATPAAGAAPSRPRVREVPSTEAESPAPQAPPGPAERPVRPKRALAEELLAFLEGQAVPAEEPVVVPPVVEEEAVSIETLQPAGEESHERFREKYVDALPQQTPYAVEETLAPRPYALTDAPPERPYLVEKATTPQPYAIHDPSKKKGRLTRSELRHAFVMKEVLGLPKALE